MSEHNHTRVERRCDVAVVGGSAAGLSAALQIQRQNRSVIVIDSGEPRNASAVHMHGYLGYDGAVPADLIADGRSEVRRYGAEVLNGRVTAVRRSDAGFLVDVDHVLITARRVVAATGVEDGLPEIAGLADHWGGAVVHCPFCHGYEIRDQRLVQILTSPLGLHQTQLFAHLSGDLTVIVSPDVEVDQPELRALERRGVTVVAGEVGQVSESADGILNGVELDDGRRIDAEAVIVTTHLRPRIDPFAELGLRVDPHPSGVGDVVAVDSTGRTGIDGLYAAGNMTDPSHQVAAAAAHGGFVGAMVAVDLASEGPDTSMGSSAVEDEWNERYAGDEVWSGTPNGTLVDEVSSERPGRALDVGAGEGGDALWLAEQGWVVTATDVAQAGLDRLAARATEQEVDIRCLVTDANTPAPYPERAFDLVSLFYPAIPRSGDDRAVANIMSAVAPGGTLLVVGHHPVEPGAPGADHSWTRAWDADSYVGIGHFETAIRSSDDWTVVTSDVRHRPPGSATHHYHDRDVVLRAVRAG